MPRTKQPRSWRRRVAEWVIALALVYAGYVVLALVIQERMIFPRHFAGGERLAVEHVPGMEEVWLTAPDGEKIVGWFMAGEGRSATSPGGAVIFAHGNGERIDDNVGLARMYAGMGVSALMVEYRGYGRAPGSPSQRAIVGDFVVFRDWLAQRPEVAPERIAHHGRSLGGGVVTALAAERAPAAMILESTFTSAAAMFNRYGLPGWVNRHPFRSDRVLPGLGVPTLIMHGTSDLIVPFSHGKKLAAMTPGARFVEFDSGHNDLPPDPGRYRDEIRTVLESAGVIAPGSGRP